MDEAQVGAALLERADELSQRVVALVWERVPGYEPPRIERGDLAGAVLPNVEAVLGHLTRATDPDESDHERAAGLGTERALQGIPLDVVVQSFRTAERVLADAFVADARELSTEGMRRGLQRLAAAFDRLLAWAIESYRQTQEEITSHYDRAAGDLVAGLVTGDLTDDVVRRQAQALGLAVDLPCQAVALRTAAEVGRGPARLQRELLGALGVVRRGRIVVGAARGATIFLVPGHITPAIRRQLEDLTHGHHEDRPRISVGTGAPDLAGAGPSCRRALAALDVHRLAGLVVFDEALLDLLVTEPAEVSDRLRELLAGVLEGAPHLTQTISVHLDFDMNMAASARALRVHPNTIAYRLGRIRDLTGFDPRRPRDLLLLELAVRAVARG